MKSTKAFSLSPMERVELVRMKGLDGGELWVPLSKPEDTHAFVAGRGWVKVGKGNERATPVPFPKEWTAEQVKEVYGRYGFSGAQAMLMGWGSWSLYEDMSYGLAYHRAEVANMCLYGKAYDEFTDRMQAAGDRFVAGLMARGFRMDGKWLWHGERLVFSLDNESVHPLMHVDHSLRGIFRIPPSFDSVSFDRMLVRLFMGKYGVPGMERVGGAGPVLERVVSVRDRIAHLTDEGTADGIGSVFELQKAFVV